MSWHPEVPSMKPGRINLKYFSGPVAKDRSRQAMIVRT